MARIAGTQTLYEGWMMLTRLTIEDGADRYQREVEHHGDAAAVLPYDPERGVATLVRQLRAPLLVRQAGLSLEAPAGLTDGGDFAETALREAFEETGIRLAALDHVATLWALPGVSTERIGLFLGTYSASDRIEAGGGLAEEHENIEVLEFGLDELWAMAGRGELADHKTYTLLLALRLRRPALFAHAE